jgi:CheY-like chemotaxis protein
MIGPSTERHTVLIADDDNAARALARTVLDTGAYRLIEATDGEEALALARSERPDLILLDVSMPGMHGTRLRKCSSPARPPAA